MAKSSDRNELIIDSFAGGGGASLGITWALGRGPDVAINHKAKAIEMHRANHPETVHLTEDVFKTDPRKATKGKPVGLLWASPDCTHHSRAKGGKPVKKTIRGLAWVVIKWAGTVKPRVIVLENVREFEQWGPVCPLWKCGACKWSGTAGQAKLGRRKKGRCPECESPTVKATNETIPNPEKKGLTFRMFVGRLKALGYAVQWRTLNAAEFGAPTHRHRLFLVARCDGQQIAWPDATHGDPKTIGKDLFSGDLKPWRTAAECIDWSLPCPSIFLTKEEAKQFGVRRPLKPNTLKRIALGIKRYVLDNPRPFVVVNTTGNPPTGTDEPLKTATTGNHHYLVTPTVIRTDMHQSNAGCAYDPQDPLRTITSGGGFGAVCPVLVPVTHAGDRRANSPEEPLPTVTCANRGEMALVSPILVQRYTEAPGRSARCSSVEVPVPTVTTTANCGSVVTAFLAHLAHGENKGSRSARASSSLESPTGVIQAQGNNFACVAANLVHLNHGEKTVSGVDEPSRTVTAQGNHAALVYSFLTQYNGTSVGTSLDAPLNTQSTKDRFGLVTVTIDGQQYAIVDIGMRMLTPRELARAQGFPDWYLLTGTKSDQVERIGNSVSPYVAKAVVAANCPDLVAKGMAA